MVEIQHSDLTQCQVRKEGGVEGGRGGIDPAERKREISYGRARVVCVLISDHIYWAILERNNANNTGRRSPDDGREEEAR